MSLKRLISYSKIYKIIEIVVTLVGFAEILEWVIDNSDKAVEVIIDFLNPNYLTEYEREKVKLLLSNDFPEIEQCLNDDTCCESELIQCIRENLQLITRERVADLIFKLKDILD